MSGHSTEGVEPNLTPILDMVFQLITFFMLVINFKGAALDLSLQLPVLGSARPLEYAGSMEPLLLNINVQGQVKSYGKSVEVDTFVPHEARLVRMHLKALGTPLGDADELPIPVIIRADKTTNFEHIIRIIRLCQAHGYRQIALSAMNRIEEKQR
ncbi:MAG: biopolymer transporter ExbD [Planctomycetota bacterium]|nr:MAG: biopolymer transporter ExbD [Planctomycetota bacterium]